MKLLLLFTLVAVYDFGFTQSIHSVDEIQPKESFENIYVHKIDGDDLTTQFIIWVKDTVRTHQHKNHSETVYVLEGEGMFYFEDSIFSIKKGDFIFIPKQTWHSVKVTSSNSMKVISNQSPAFYGEDRIYKDQGE